MLLQFAEKIMKNYQGVEIKYPQDWTDMKVTRINIYYYIFDGVFFYLLITIALLFFV